ncbi:hypothetical protein WJX77_009520 [Trebouxia sp. C0004]
MVRLNESSRASAQNFLNAHSQYGKDLSCGKFVSWKLVQQRLHQLAEEFSSPIGDHHDKLAESILRRLAITMNQVKVKVKTMNHQLARGIAQHSAEAKSWALLVAIAVFSRLHFSSVMP